MTFRLDNKTGTKRSLLYRILRLLTSLCFFCELIFASSASGEVSSRPYWLITAFYLTYLFVFPLKYAANRKGPGITALNIAMFIRYVIGILSVYSNNSFSSYLFYRQGLTEALILMLYEQTCVFACVLLTSKNSPNTSKHHTDEELSGAVIMRYLRANGGLLLFLFAIVAFAIFAVTVRDLGNGFQLISQGFVSNGTSDDSDSSGLLGIFWQTLCVWIFVYMIIGQAEKYLQNKEAVQIRIAVLITLLYVLLIMIDQTRISRWYPVVTAAASVAFMLKLFPDASRSIVKSVCIPVLVLLVIMTLYKNAGYVSGGSVSIIDSLSSLFNPTLMDSYASGIAGVASSVGLAEFSSLGLINVVNDMLNNMPIINHFMDPTATTYHAYNAFLGRVGSDQIIPLIGQSRIYFGFAFAPLLSVLFVCLSRLCDRLYLKHTCCTTYIFGFLGIWFALIGPMLNLTICCSWLYIRVIPFSLALLLTDYLVKGGRRAVEKRKILGTGRI